MIITDISIVGEFIIIQALLSLSNEFLCKIKRTVCKLCSDWITMFYQECINVAISRLFLLVTFRELLHKRPVLIRLNIFSRDILLLNYLIILFFNLCCYYQAQHEKNCPYRPMPCVACGAPVSRALLEQHQERECPQRKVHCEHCISEISAANREVC